jgi:hypothetical protein
MKRCWEMIADKLSKAGWSLGWVSAIDSDGRTLWIVDAHRDNGKRFVVPSDEILSAFLELEQNTHELAVSAVLGNDSQRDCHDTLPWLISFSLDLIEYEYDCRY